MLQYFINTTAIWLISLALFDAFLRRESYHNYNRFYLLFTFLLGALLPLWQWQDNSHHYSWDFQKTLEQVVAVKQTIVTATTPATSTIDWQYWLGIIYLAGVVAAISLLIIDIVRLINYYRSGKKSIQDGWTIVQTGKDHAPFSLMNTLFVSSLKQYSREEWSMILVHEKRHTTLLHFVDLLLMQAARIVFWVHPLVYLYNKRLLLVHEYQADNASAQKPQVYGAFLVEQALLQTAPSLAHSFNRSPIKNRIVMLTRRSSAASRTKMLVFIPLALVSIVCFSKNARSHGYIKYGDIVTCRDNKFELSQATHDTVIMVDPVTGKEFTKYSWGGSKPIKMNGRPIVQDVEQEPYFTGSDKDLEDYLVKNMKDELADLDNGKYRLEISDVVIDDNGRIVYFKYQGVANINYQYETNDSLPKSYIIATNKPPVNGAISAKNRTWRKNEGPENNNPLSNKEQDALFDKVCRLLEVAPAFLPAKSGGQKVISLYYSKSLQNNFKVINHKVYVMEKGSEYKEL